MILSDARPMFLSGRTALKLAVCGLAVPALGIAGCVGGQGASTHPRSAATRAPASLVGTWILQSFENLPAPMPLTLNLTSDGRASGHVDCNRFFGSYSLAQGQIRFTAPGMTRMACPPRADDARAQAMAIDLFDKGGAVSLSTDGRRLDIAERYVFLRGEDQ